jgi:hypothetical protein
LSSRVNLSISVVLVFGAIAWLVGAMNIRHMLKTDHIGEGGLAVFLGVMVLVLSISLIIRYVPLVRAEVRTNEASLNEPGDEEQDLPASNTRPIAFMAACGAWTVLLQPIGFLFATPVFIAAELWMLGYRRPVLVFVIAVTSTVAMWVIFDLILQINLPGGLHRQFTDRIRL